MIGHFIYFQLGKDPRLFKLNFILLLVITFLFPILFNYEQDRQGISYSNPFAD
jgi:hypothetical protein